MKRKIIMLIVIFLIIAIIAGIAIYQKNNNKTNSNSTVIKMNEVTRSVFYAPQYVAINNGYFKDYNIEIDLTTGQGADAVMTSVLSGESQIGFAGPEASIYVYNEGKSTWDTFKKAISAKNADHETKKQVPEVWYRVRKTWKNAGSQVGAFKTLKQAKQCADQYAGYRVYNTSGKKVYVSLKLPYKVQVKTGTIPVRSGPAKTYRRVKQISKGVFEITEEKNGFGKLKSGAGWIYLKKVERV